MASSLSVPVLGPRGLAGVITVFRAMPGKPKRDDLDLVTLYAGYAASAIERDRLLDEVTARNRVLETIREMLETLAGPLPVSQSLRVALQALCRGLQADEAALVSCRAGPGAADPGRGRPRQRAVASGGPARLRRQRARARRARTTSPCRRSARRGRLLAVPFAAPGGAAALVACWRTGTQPADAAALVEDAARSLQLALEREEASVAHQEALTLRRSQELQRGFLSRLSHELRTPLTAIRGYASSLLQPDVTWDGESQHRFLRRIAAESARLGRLVDDLLDFSAIESGILRLQRDWCDLPLVLEAAIACLPPDTSPPVQMTCAPDLPVIWADHDRLEQVFVNLLANAVGHNPAGTNVRGRRERRRRARRGHGRRRRRRPQPGYGQGTVRAGPAPPRADGRRRARAVHRAGNRCGARRPHRAGLAAPRDLLPDLPADRGGDQAARPAAAQPDRRPAAEPWRWLTSGPRPPGRG